MTHRLPIAPCLQVSWYVSYGTVATRMSMSCGATFPGAWVPYEHAMFTYSTCTAVNCYNISSYNISRYA